MVSADQQVLKSASELDAAPEKILHDKCFSDLITTGKKNDNYSTYWAAEDNNKMFEPMGHVTSVSWLAFRAYTSHPDALGIEKKTWAALVYGVHAELSKAIPEKAHVTRCDSAALPDVDVIKNHLDQWKAFFEAYQQQQKDKVSVWLTANTMAIVYGLSEGLLSAVGLMLLFGASGGLPLIVAAISIGIVSTSANYQYASSELKEFFVSCRRSREDIVDKTTRRNVLFVVGSISFCVLAAVVTGLASGLSIHDHFGAFSELFKSSVSTSSGMMGVIWPLAIAVIAVTILCESLVFVKACIDFYAQGGPAKVMRDTVKRSLKDNHGKWRKLACLVLFCLIVCNITGITMVATGSIGGFKDIVHLSSQAAAISIVATAGLGLAFFYIRQSLGFAADVDELCVKGWQEHINKQTIKEAVLGHFPFVLGVIMAIVCVATGYGMIGIAGVCVSMALTVAMRKVLRKKDKGLLSMERIGNGFGNGLFADSNTGLGIAGVVPADVSSTTATHVSQMPTAAQEKRLDAVTGLYTAALANNNSAAKTASSQPPTGLPGRPIGQPIMTTQSGPARKVQVVAPMAASRKAISDATAARAQARSAQAQARVAQAQASFAQTQARVAQARAVDAIQRHHLAVAKAQAAVAAKDKHAAQAPATTHTGGVQAVITTTSIPTPGRPPGASIVSGSASGKPQKLVLGRHRVGHSWVTISKAANHTMTTAVTVSSS